MFKKFYHRLMLNVSYREFMELDLDDPFVDVFDVFKKANAVFKHLDIDNIDKNNLMDEKEYNATNICYLSNNITNLNSRINREDFTLAKNPSHLVSPIPTLEWGRYGGEDGEFEMGIKVLRNSISSLTNLLESKEDFDPSIVPRRWHRNIKLHCKDIDTLLSHILKR